MFDSGISRRAAKPAGLLALAAAGAVCASPSAAVTVQGATFGQLATARVGRVPHSRETHRPGTITETITRQGGSATSTESIARLPGPTLSSAGTVTGRGGASGETSLGYYFQVVGPKPVQVPLIVTASGTLSGTSAKISSFVKAEIITNLGGFIYPVDDACPRGPSGTKRFCGSYSVPKSMKVTAWTKQEAAGPNVIQLLATSDVSGAGSAAASLGTVIRIDPRFRDAGKYHIVVSKGIGNP